MQQDNVNRPQTIAQYVIAQLRYKILNGEIAAGEKLRQDYVAEEYGVSSTPVREALKVLATEGLLEFLPHKGAVVKGLTLADVKEIYALRMELEPLLIRWKSERLAEIDLEKCADLAKQMKETRDLVEWANLNDRFHANLLAFNTNSRLAKMVDDLRHASIPYVIFSLHDREDEIRISNDDHLGLIDAYRHGDIDNIIKLLKRHLSGTIHLIELKFKKIEMKKE